MMSRPKISPQQEADVVHGHLDRVPYKILIFKTGISHRTVLNVLHRNGLKSRYKLRKVRKEYNENHRQKRTRRRQGGKQGHSLSVDPRG
jgi:hypothetical protein